MAHTQDKKNKAVDERDGVREKGGEGSTDKGGRGESTGKGVEGTDKSNDVDAVRFEPQEEASLLAESNTTKSQANALFAAKSYQDALDTYLLALGTCPVYLLFPRAVLQSNIAACHLQLEDWKDAIKAATDALDGLEKLEREVEEKDKEDEEAEEEIISTGAQNAAPAPVKEDTFKADVHRIRTKSLLRRARARAQAGGWHNLAGAEEDYKTLSTMAGLTPSDQRTVRTQLRDLPPRTKAAQESEMGEMWGKLKDLGNGILKPFGLSTSNFQMVKDEKSGGYSMNFKQN